RGRGRVGGSPRWRVRRTPASPSARPRSSAPGCAARYRVSTSPERTTTRRNTAPPSGYVVRRGGEGDGQRRVHGSRDGGDGRGRSAGRRRAGRHEGPASWRVGWGGVRGVRGRSRRRPTAVG